MRLLGLLTVLSFSMHLCAATFYVDNTLGSDSNNGLSVSFPWKTVTKVKNSSFSPGDFILFKRGEVWNDSDLNCSSSGSAGNYITYGSYGTGVRPIITGMRLIPNWTNSSSWVNEGDNIWRITCTSDNIRRLKLNDVEYLSAYSESPLYLNDTERWHFDGGGDALWVYSTGNPATNYNSIKGTIPKMTVNTDKENFIIFEDLDFQGAYDYCVAITGSHDVIVRNSTVGKLSNRGFNIHNFWGNAPVSYNVLIDNCEIDADFTFHIPEQPRYRGSFDGVYVIMGSHDVEVKNCSFINWGHNGFVIYQNPGKGSIYNVNVHHNYFTAEDLLYGRAMGTDATEDGGTSNIEIHHNLIEHQRAPSQMNGEGLHFHHNIVDDTKNASLNLIGWNVGHGVALQAYSGRIKNNIYEHNTIVNSDLSGIGVHGKVGDESLSECIIRNNLIYNGGRNTLSEPNVGLRIVNANVTNMKFENNLIFSPNSNSVVYYDGGIKNITQFNALNGDDGHVITQNVAIDPLFVDATNQDYHLSTASLAIDAGTISTTTQDYDGNAMPIGGSYDIGAFEVQTVLAVELIEWSAKMMEKGEVELKWATEEEEDNRQFVIERRTGTSGFLEIKKIEGQGTSYNRTSYSHIDVVEGGMHYYRLKIIDNDGEYTYSSIVAIDNTQMVISDFYPNPSNGNVSIDILREIKSLSLQVYTNTGVKITSLEFNGDQISGNASKEIALSHIGSGVFIVDVYVNDAFIKRHFLLIME